MKCHLGGLANQFFDMFGIVHARQLNQDVFPALALDGRFLGPQRIDTTTHNFNTARQRVRHHFVALFFRIRQCYRPPVGFNVNRVAQHAFQPALGTGYIVTVTDNERHGAVDVAQIGITDNPLVPVNQCRARFFVQLRGFFLEHGFGVNFQQQLGAAL